MNRRYIVAATVLSIAACATSTPESPEPAADAENTVTDSDSTEAELEVLDVPEVPDTPIAANIRHPDQLVCRYELGTGTHMRTRVCRIGAEIHAMRKSGQEAVRAMGLPNVTSTPPDH